jgi:hypothetical protein
MAELPFFAAEKSLRGGQIGNCFSAETGVADVATDSSRSEVGQSRRTLPAAQRGSGFAGQLACTAEQSVQDQ